MMTEYRGYKSYRHFINAKLNALAVNITGPESAKDYLRDLVYKIFDNKQEALFEVIPEGTSGIQQLSDQEAKKLYYELIGICKTVKANMQATNALTGNTVKTGITPSQRKAIIKITKYDFQWSPEATFSFILGIFPEKRKKLSTWEIDHSKLFRLYSLISKVDADKIIKRLDKIKKRNAAQESVK